MAAHPSPADIASRMDGGSVSAVSTSPLGEPTAFLWSQRDFPAWYRVGVVDDAGAMALTSPEARIWGPPLWAPSGALAVGGFVGTRRVVFEVDLGTGSTRPVAGGPEASYELVEHESSGVALCRRRGIDGSVDLVRVDGGSDELLAEERPGHPGWAEARLVAWRSAGLDLEGIFAPPATGEPPWPAMVFLHGGPVGILAVGEVERVGAWVDPRRATFIPEFPASGICGEAAMLAAFEALELPEHDREVDTVLAGIDALVEAGLVDDERLFVVGHSYGAYLMNRALTRTDRFRAAVCWEGVADLRALGEQSLAAQATWRGWTTARDPDAVERGEPRRPGRAGANPDASVLRGPLPACRPGPTLASSAPGCRRADRADRRGWGRPHVRRRRQLAAAVPRPRGPLVRRALSRDGLDAPIGPTADLTPPGDRSVRSVRFTGRL